MSKLEDLLRDTNDNIVKGWAFQEIEDHEGFKLIKLNGIETEDGTEGAWVATIFDMEDFMEFLAEQGGSQHD